MGTVILCLDGILLLEMGCFIGVKQRIELVHSYHLPSPFPALPL